MPIQRRASVVFNLATLGLDALGVGLIAPIAPTLVQHLAHRHESGPRPGSAPWISALIAAYAAVQFMAAPLLGAMSNRFGRRSVILVSVFGLGCDDVLLTFAPKLWWLFAGRLIAGATSANVASATGAIADMSSPQQRPSRYGLIGAIFGAGFVVGPALGGLLGGFGLRLPFVAAAAWCFLDLGFGILVLPVTFPGAPFLFAAGSAMLALLLLRRL